MEEYVMKRLLTFVTLALLVLSLGMAVSAKTTYVDLKPFFNAPGVAALDTEVEVGLDVDGGSSWASFDAAYFPAGGGEIDSQMGLNVKFQVPDLLALLNDNVEANGQVIPVTPGNYNTLYIMATSHHGATEDAPITLKYADGTVETPTISLTDWCASAAYDETAVIEMDHRVNLDGSEGTINCYMWGVSVKVNPAKQLVSIGLPQATDDFRADKFHTFAMTLESK
jgi:hypothetical protein